MTVLEHINEYYIALEEIQKKRIDGRILPELREETPFIGDGSYEKYKNFKIESETKTMEMRSVPSSLAWRWEFPPRSLRRRG